jgi:hypothetical protein
VGSVFRSFWFGEALSPVEHLCVKSFLARGHRFVLYAYDEVANVPDGCELRDAADVVPRERLFLYGNGRHAGSPAGFSNIFRYTLLDRDGGWWVDTDTLCLRDDVSEPEYVFAKQGRRLFNSAILRAPAGSLLIRTTLERAERAVANGGAEAIAFGEIGPQLLTAVVRELGLRDHAARRRDLYPIPYWRALAVLDPERRQKVEERVADSTFLHLWTETFRVRGVPKSEPPPAGSFLDAMYRRYDVPVPR